MRLIILEDKVEGVVERLTLGELSTRALKVGRSRFS